MCPSYWKHLVERGESLSLQSGSWEQSCRLHPTCPHSRDWHSPKCFPYVKPLWSFLCPQCRLGPSCCFWPRQHKPHAWRAVKENIVPPEAKHKWHLLLLVMDPSFQGPGIGQTCRVANTGPENQCALGLGPLMLLRRQLSIFTLNKQQTGLKIRRKVVRTWRISFGILTS